MNELDNLTTVETNSRRGGQNFDLHHDSEDRKFTVSDSFYAKEDMNNNGFTAHVGNDNVYLSIRPNDQAVSYKGREGFDKGKEFTSTTMSELFDKLDLPENLALSEVGEKEGYTYYRVEPITEEDTIDEEMIDSNVEPEEEVSTPTFN